MHSRPATSWHDTRRQSGTVLHTAPCQRGCWHSTLCWSGGGQVTGSSCWAHCMPAWPVSTHHLSGGLCQGLLLGVAADHCLRLPLRPLHPSWVDTAPGICLTGTVVVLHTRGAVAVAPQEGLGGRCLLHHHQHLPGGPTWGGQQEGAGSLDGTQPGDLTATLDSSCGCTVALCMCVYVRS